MNDEPIVSVPPRRLPVAVWLVPALGMALPLLAVLHGVLEDRGTSASASKAVTPTASAPAASTPASAAPAVAPTAELRRSTDFVPKPAAWSALLAAAAPEDPARGRRLVTQGNGASMPACASCHSPNSPAPQAIPALVGLPKEYIVKQLLDYQSGTRQSPIMQPIAKEMSDGDIAEAARYYAALPRPAPPLLATGGPAATLHTLGDNARALPACTNCHGASGEGGGPVLPSLSGQPGGYLASQLQAFRSGARANDDGGVMRAFASRLSADDITALDAYYAAAANGSDVKGGVK